MTLYQPTKTTLVVTAGTTPDPRIKEWWEKASLEHIEEVKKLAKQDGHEFTHILCLAEILPNAVLRYAQKVS